MYFKRKKAKMEEKRHQEQMSQISNECIGGRLKLNYIITLHVNGVNILIKCQRLSVWITLKYAEDNICTSKCEDTVVEMKNKGKYILCKFF